MDNFSFSQEGKDSHGNTVRLGETDGDGFLVGFIGADGACWESITERDVATTCGRFMDEWNQWNRCGGLLGAEPEAYVVAQRECIHPDSVDLAATEAQSQIDFEDPVSRAMMRRIAKLRNQQAQLN